MCLVNLHTDWLSYIMFYSFLTLRITGFFYFIVRYSKDVENIIFWKLDLFHPQVRGGTPTLLGPLERSNQRVQWLMLALSKWPNRVGVSPTHLTMETGSVSETLFSSFSNTERWTKSENPAIPCYTPSWEPFGIYLLQLSPYPSRRPSRLE
jgi:hypothetical protein